MLSDSPPERDVIWTEAGVQGAYKQTQRLWRLTCEIERVVGANRPAQARRLLAEAAAVRRAAHGALAKIEDEIERLRFNVCIATIYELANTLATAIGAIETEQVADDLRFAFAEAGDILVHAFAPMMPHLAEECWAGARPRDAGRHSPWPEADRSLIVSDEVTYAVQVNGRKRGELTIGRDADDGRDRSRRPGPRRGASGRWIIGRPRRSSSSRRGSSMSWSDRARGLAALALALALGGCFQPLYGEAAHPGLVEDLRRSRSRRSPIASATISATI